MTPPTWRSLPLAGAGLTLGFLLLVPPGLRAQQQVTNVAGATYDTPVGTDSVASNPVQTTVLRPQATLQKSVVGPLSAGIGQPVQYRIVYGNTSSTAAVIGAVLTDTLPNGLDYVSATPAATVSGRVLQWTLGDLLPNSSGQVDVTLTVAPTVLDTLRVRNGASLTAINAGSMVSLAGVVALIGPPSRGLAVTHSAELLEVGLGETAPFTLRIQNTGALPLTDMVVYDLLPDGSRYSPGSATGVDSARAAGRNLRFYLAGPLAPGATAILHYGMAVASATTPTLTSLAYVVADTAQVRSADAAASLKLRSGFAMEDRSVIGKVWVDQNGNGIQDAGEAGVDGAEIWTDDGEVTTTDADGRFSYRNLRPGHHGFRLDPASLPAAYQVAEATRAGADLVTRDASGWTTPRVDFRLLPRGGHLSSVRLPVGWSVAAYPETTSKDLSAVPGAVPAVAGAVPPVSGAQSPGAGVAPSVSGAVLADSGAVPPVAGAQPSVSGGAPVVSGAAMPVTGALPRVPGEVPAVSGAVPPVSGAQPPASNSQSPAASAPPSHGTAVPAVQPATATSTFSLPPLNVEIAGFAFAKARLRPAAVATLHQIADSLLVHDAVRIEIAGHADSIGPRAYNFRLSLARARSVQRVLVQAGIDSSRMVLRGYGPDRPVASNATRRGRARNRRWEITLLAEAASAPTEPRRLEPMPGQSRNSAPTVAPNSPLTESQRVEPMLGQSRDSFPTLAHDPAPTASDRVEPMPDTNPDGFSGSVPDTVLIGAAPPGRTGHRLRYEAGISNRYGLALDGLTLRFPSTVDSMVLLTGDSVLARGSGSSMKLPSIPAEANLRVVAWGERPSDSTGVSLERDGRVLDQASVPGAGSGGRVERTITPEFSSDSLPDPAAVPTRGEVEITVSPPPGGWPGSASFPLPPGWEPAPDPGSDSLSPTLGQDRSGSPVLFWQFGTTSRSPIVLRIRPIGAAIPVEPPRIPVLRTPESRAAERQREFLDGPGVAIFNPEDGQVLALDRVYIGVRGESGAPVALYDGDSLIQKTNLRIDGVQDFIAVPLEPGPHRLRVWMQNSASRERWDSIAVHVTGAPARFVAESAHVTLMADGHTLETMRVRALDRWGVPVINHPDITVDATGAMPVNHDANPSSLGIQVAPDEAGWLSVRLRPGHTVMRGKLRMTWAGVNQELPFDVLPASQPLLVTGVGQVGVGSSPDAFGALTARGRLDRRTSVVVSYDSRRLDAGRDAFGRSANPLEEAQYPILGDASTQRTSSASRYQLAARVERGFDWLALGDISTTGFGSGLQLSGYRRALPGMAAQITTGAVVWQGFGSSTSQQLRQLQVRGAGISGPYQLALNIRDGTEQVVLETRAQENATRVLSRQVLDRFVDYEIDYAAGTLLFKQPVPAMDGYGNPVFIVVLYESAGGGSQSQVWGLRGSLDGNRWLKSPLLDSLGVGATWVHESPEAGGHQLLGADLRLLRVGALELSGETSWSRSRDSSGVAAAVSGAVTLLGGSARLHASWMTAGREFGNPSSAAVQGGTEELRFGGELKQGTHQLQLTHEWQRFGSLGLSRRHTSGAITQSLGSQFEVKATMTGDRFTGATSPTNSVGGELRFQWKPEARWTLFTEGRHQFRSEGAGVQPDYVGAGASYDVTRNVALDLRHRQVFLPGDSGGYGVTELGVRTRIGTGTEAYGKYQIAGVDGGRNAALVGLRNHMMLGTAWALNVQAERRSGVGRASVLDPVRSLPFLQAEENYWSIGMGAEFLQPGSPLRLGARGELRNGDTRSTRLVTVAGDVSLNRSLAVLSRQELLRTDQNGAGTLTRGHRYSTLWGLALRPVHTDVLNLLGKVEWIDADNGGGAGVLAGSRAEGRTILAGEAVWQPRPGSELAARYAFRRSTGSLVASDGTTLRVRSLADFVGWRGSVRVRSFLELRADGRLLNERVSGISRYDLAPQLAFVPQQLLEIVAGYRLGNLRDPDFAVDGGHGWFVTFGARITEGTVSSAAAFWRQRLGGQ